jgi:hypothetical protein
MKFKKFDMAEGGSNGGLFFKIKNGESRMGVIRGEIYEFYSRWVGGKSFVVTAGEENAKPKFRVNIVVYDEKEKVFRALIWEFGLMIYQQLADIAQETDITKLKLKITRRGEGLDTTYTVMPPLSDKDKLTPKQLEQIEAVPLKILEHKEEVAPADTEGNDGDLPF